jgi:hypothetical protein
LRRNIIDTLRRGVDNTLANWQLSAIRFAEVMVLGILAIAAVIAALIPIFVSIGIRIADLNSPDQIESAMMTLLEKWMLFVWFFVGISVMVLIFVIIHSFVEAGCARVFVDADRAAGPAVQGGRQRYRLFTIDRWLGGAKHGGWTVFWIYNLAWGAAGIVLLVPLIPIFALIVMFHEENPGAAVGVGCLGIIVFMLFAIVVAIVTGMWTNRAIADWAAGDGNARHALATGWRAVKTDLGRHLLVALAIFVVAMAGSSFFAGFSMFAAFGDSFGHNASFNMMTLPIRLAGSLLSSAFSALIGSWYLASYGALAVESKP